MGAIPRLTSLDRTRIRQRASFLYTTARHPLYVNAGARGGWPEGGPPFEKSHFAFSYTGLTPKTRAADL